MIDASVAIAESKTSASVVLTIRVPKPMAGELRLIAEELAMPVANLVRLILRTWLRAQRPAA